MFSNTKMNITKEFIIRKSIYVNENEFEKVKSMDKEPNQNLKKLLKEIRVFSNKNLKSIQDN